MRGGLTVAGVTLLITGLLVPPREAAPISSPDKSGATASLNEEVQLLSSPAAPVAKADTTGPSIVPSSKSAGEKKAADPSKMSKAEKKRLREKIKELRRQRKEQFAELTRGFIRKIITPESILSKEEFLVPLKRDLETCVERAIDVHVPALTARERIKLAKTRVLKSIRDLLAEASIELEDREGSLSGQAFTGDSYHVRFRQPAFRGGNLWHTFLKEQATLRGAEAEYHLIVNDLIQKVSEAYLDTIRTANVIQDRKAVLEVADKQLAQSIAKWNQGIISEIEYLNMESLQSQMAHDLEQSKQEHELVLLELQKNLGLDLADRIELVALYDYASVMARALEASERGRKAKASPMEVQEFTKPLDEYIKMAYEHRPDLKMEASRLRANIMAKRAAVGKLLPQVNVLMDFGELAEAFTDSADDPPHIPEWQVAMELTWNLAGTTAKYTLDHDKNAPSVSQFQAGQGSVTTKNSFSIALLDNLEDIYRLKEAQVEIMDQFVKLEQKEREVIREVKEAYFNFRRAQIQLESETKQLLYRERLAKLNKHKLEQNEIQASEYIESERDLVEEKAQFHKAMADYYVARVGLNRAVGLRGLLPVQRWE